MPAYVITDLVDVADPERYGQYRPVGAATLAKYGGTYLARGGAVETLEGDWKATRVGILRFESMDAARAWYNSPEYVAARRLREGAVSVRFLLVEGVEPA
jgi:uncharacterized protein (DUF1330 family)